MQPVVATHNIMHGRQLASLLPRYRELRAQVGLDLLCIQENVDDAADEIATALSEHHRALVEPEHGGLAVIYDGTRFEVQAQASVPLPQLERLTAFERLYIAGGRTRRRYGQIVTFRNLTVANVHLETAGDNAHRRSQVEVVAQTLGSREHAGGFICCGDTNAFAWRDHAVALGEVLAPLADLGAEAGDGGPTHYFARQNEPVLGHKICRFVGRFGIDVPRRYDVVCTDRSVHARGQVHTPESDHDLVWATFQLDGGQ